MRGMCFVLFILIVSLCQCKNSNSEDDNASKQRDEEYRRQYKEYKNENGRVLKEKQDVALLKNLLGKLFSTKSGCCGAFERELFSFLPPAERKQLAFSVLDRILSQDIGKVNNQTIDRVQRLCPSEFDEFVKSGRLSAHIWAAIRAKKDIDASLLFLYVPKAEQEKVYEELSKLELEKLNACKEKCGLTVWKLFGFAHRLPKNKGAPLFREIVKKAIKYGDALTAKLAKERLGGKLDDAELQEVYGNCVARIKDWRDCAQSIGADVDRLKLSDKQRQDLFLREAWNCHLRDLDARYAKVFHKRLPDDGFYKMVEHCTADSDYWNTYEATEALIRRSKKQ